MGTRRLTIVTLLGATTLVAAGVVRDTDGSRTGDDGAVSGERLYRLYCVSCHGPEGRGDGEAASRLEVRPADLTRLAERWGGRFEAHRAREAIDGRTASTAPAHRVMPAWGLDLQDLASDADQERGVRRRIDDLVLYLESLQAEERADPDDR